MWDEDPLYLLDEKLMKTRVIELTAGEIPTMYDFDSYKDAKAYVDKIVAAARKKKLKVSKSDASKVAYNIDTNYIYIEEPKTPATKSRSNNQNINQQKQKTMPKGLVIGTTKDGKPVYGNATVSAVYRKNGSKNRKPSMNVPAQFVTLPSPFYTFGRKHLNEGKPNQRNFVIGATKSKNNRNIYVVAQLTYMGGKPAVTENRYKGYSRFTAWSVFNELPYHMKWIKDANNNWKETTGDGQTKTAVAEAIAIRKAAAAARANKK